VSRAEYIFELQEVGSVAYALFDILITFPFPSFAANLLAVPHPPAPPPTTTSLHNTTQQQCERNRY
jgi:hypothetical protein